MRHLRVAVVLLISAIPGFAGNNSGMHWKLESGAAWKEARDTAHPILVEVWADWCPPCRQMEREVWSDASVTEAANRFVQISIDVSRRDEGHIGGVTLGSHGLYTVNAVPTVLLLDPWGEILASTEGFVYPKDMGAMLAQIPADYSSVREQREALLSDRDNSRDLAAVGMLYQHNSSFSLANRYFKEALAAPGAKEDDRMREQLMFGMATNEIRLADWKAARKHLEAFRAAFPASSFLDQVLLGFVVVDVRQKKMKDAEQHAAELRSSFPGSKMVAEADRLLGERAK